MPLISYSAADLLARKANPALASYGVSDTAANILGQLSVLSLDPRIASLQVSDGSALLVTAAQFIAYQSFLGRLVVGQSLVVSGLNVAGAAAAQANTRVTSFSLSDSAATILASVKTLSTNTKLGSITLTDTDTLTVEGATFLAYKSTLDKLAPGEAMVVTGVAAGKAALVQADALVASFTVSDTRLNVWNNIDALNALTRLTKITLTDGGPLNVTYAKFLADGAAVAKIGAVTVSDVTASGAAAAVQNAAVQKIAVSDGLAQIGAALDALQLIAKAGKLSGIRVADAGQTLTISQAKYLADRDAIALLGSAVLNVTDVTAANAALIQGDSRVKAFSLGDTAANVMVALKALGGATKLGAIVLTDTDLLTVDAATYTTAKGTLAKLSGADSMRVLGLTVANAALAQSDVDVSSFTISDSAARISASLASLATASKLGSFTLVGGSVLALTGDSFATYQATLDKLAAGNTITVNGVSVAKAAIAQADNQIASFTVSDTAANIKAALAALSLDTRMASYKVTDAATLTVTADQFGGYRGMLDKIAPGQSLIVTGVAVADAAGVQADARVGSFGVIDTAANVLGNLAALKLSTRLGSIVLSDTDTLTVDGATFVAHKTTLDKLAPGESMIVTGLGAAYAGLAQADSQVVSFTVSDTRANVWKNIDALNAASHLTKINLTDGGSLNVTYAKYLGGAAVEKIGAVTVSDVSADAAAAVMRNAAVKGITVTDTLAHIGASLGTLDAMAEAGVLTAIKVSDSDQVLKLSRADYAKYSDAIALMTGSYEVDPLSTSKFEIDLRYNPSMANAPAAYKMALNTVVQYFEDLITSDITINMGVGYGEVGGGVIGSGTLGAAGPTSGVNITYTQFKAALAAHATSPDQIKAVANMGADPTKGGTIFVAGAEAKALGLMAPDAPGLDGMMGFSSRYAFTYDPDDRDVAGKFDFFGIAQHELTHAMGRIGLLGNGYYSALDLFRYSAPGVHNLDPDARTYFSIDGGKTNLNWYVIGADVVGWVGTAAPDANSAFATSGVVLNFSAADLTVMNILGYAYA